MRVGEWLTFPKNFYSLPMHWHFVIVHSLRHAWSAGECLFVGELTLTPDVVDDELKSLSMIIAPLIMAKAYFIVSIPNSSIHLMCVILSPEYSSHRIAHHYEWDTFVGILSWVYTTPIHNIGCKPTSGCKCYASCRISDTVRVFSILCWMCCSLSCCSCSLSLVLTAWVPANLISYIVCR